MNMTVAATSATAVTAPSKPGNQNAVASGMFEKVCAIVAMSEAGIDATQKSKEASG
jgi:hypothetical protein